MLNIREKIFLRQLVIKLSSRVLTHFDFSSLLLMLPIIIFSFVLISEANELLAKKQLLYFGVGALAFLIFFLLPMRKLEWLIPFVYWANIALLLLVNLVGTSRLGAKRWIEVPWTSFTIQPSEIFKPAFILMIAYLIKQNPPPEEGYGVKSFCKLSFFILLPFVLILKEPDLGSAAVILLVGFGLLFLAGVSHKIWLSLILIIGLSAPFMYSNLKDYQKQRIADFVGDKTSYHVKQSIIAIGSGGVLGKNKEEATQTHFKFLPIATSDFIYAYAVERHGFLAGFALLLTYFLLICHLLSLNYRLAQDHLAKTCINALALFIFLYVGVNISMSLGLAPVVGIPLPLFSYGGSSFTTFMIMFGIMQNLITFRFDSSYKMLRILR